MVDSIKKLKSGKPIEKAAEKPAPQTPAEKPKDIEMQETQAAGQPSEQIYVFGLHVLCKL